MFLPKSLERPTAANDLVRPDGSRSAAVWIGALCLGLSSVAQAQERAVEGVWGSAATTPDHPSWRVEDLVFPAGPKVGYEHLVELLDDPSNASRPLRELAAEARQAGLAHARTLVVAPSDSTEANEPADDPRVRCEPLPATAILMGPRPFSIDVIGDEVVIHHEEGNTVRRIPLAESVRLDESSSRFGAAVARFEANTLIVESTRVDPHPVPLGVVTTSELRLVERYAPDASDPNRLEVELALDDPAVFREPLVLIGLRVRIDGEIYVDPPCELISGEFEGAEVGP